MRTEIRICGFGGQGVILAGIILGKSASLFDNKEAVQTQSYGPEARGGASKCEVVISDDTVDYPKVESPDILVAMSNEALIKYIVDLKDNGTLIVDPDTTDVEDVKDYIEEHNIISSTIIRNKLVYEISQIAPADTKAVVTNQIKEKIPSALYDKVSEDLLKDQCCSIWIHCLECITEMADAWKEVNGENLVWVPGHYERKD